MITETLAIVVSIMIGTLVYQKLKHKNCISKKVLHGQTALVTGGTAGMGLEVATELAKRGAHVIIASPYPSEGKTALQHIITKTSSTKVDFIPMDLGSFEDTRRAANEIIAGYDSLHLLINNAGIGGPSDKTKDGFNRIVQVNYLGSVLLTILLLPLLKRTGQEETSRVVNIASYMHVLGKFDAGQWNKCYSPVKAYSDSKLCVVMFTRELAKRLKSNVVVNSVEPGTVSTNIYKTWNRYYGTLLTLLTGLFMKSAWQGAQTALHVTLDERAGDVTGQYFAECRVTEPSSKVLHELDSRQLWDESLKAVQLTDIEVKTALC